MSLTSLDPWTISSDDYNGQAMGIGFLDHMDLDALDIDFFDSSVPHVESESPNLALPPVMTTDDRYLKMTRLYTGAPSLSADLTLQNEANLDLGFEQQTIGRSSHPLLCDQSSTNAFQQPYISPSTVGDPPSYKARPYPLTLLRGQNRRRELPYIKPKPTLYSSNVTKGSKPQGIQKNTGRLGRLSAEQRKAAFEVRKIGACVSCRIRKAKVTWKKYPWW